MEVAIKTGLPVYAVGHRPHQWRFWCLSPQTKDINPQRWQWGNQPEQDINKKVGESKEEACAETEREMFGRFLDAYVATAFFASMILQILYQIYKLINNKLLDKTST